MAMHVVCHKDAGARGTDVDPVWLPCVCRKSSQSINQSSERLEINLWSSEDQSINQPYEHPLKHMKLSKIQFFNPPLRTYSTKKSSVRRRQSRQWKLVLNSRKQPPLEGNSSATNSSGKPSYPLRPRQLHRNPRKWNSPALLSNHRRSELPWAW